MGRSSPLSHAQTNSTGFTVGFRPSHCDNRQKGFILPADLEEKRYQLRQNPQIQRSLSSNKLTKTIHQKQADKNRPKSREEIESRWSKLMENDEVLRKSIKGTSDERDALR
jgi:hypothetical protein